MSAAASSGYHGKTPTAPPGKPKAGAKDKRKGRKATIVPESVDVPDPNNEERIGLSGDLKPGQTITDGLKETADSLAKQLAPHYEGWTPQKQLAAMAALQSKEKEHRKERRASQQIAAETLGPLATKGDVAALASELQASAHRDEEPEDESPFDIAGEPGSDMWSAMLMMDQIEEVMDRLNTDPLETLLTQQLEELHQTTKANEYIPDWTDKMAQNGDELAETAASQSKHLEAKLQKATKRSHDGLERAEVVGKKMVEVIQSALAQRERVRQQLFQDIDIVITEEKKTLLEEKRKLGQELRLRMSEIKQLEEEDGNGIKEPQAVTDLRDKIERKGKRQAKLKADHDLVQTRLRALEQALMLTEKWGDKGGSQDDAALEILEEAKGAARDQVLVPLLRKLEEEHDLNQAELELPQELLDERDKLMQSISKVEEDLATLEKQRQEDLVLQTQVKEETERIGDETERRLSQFSAMRRRSSGTEFQVEPPMALPMPDIDISQAIKLQNGLKKSFRTFHRELALQVDLAPKYVALLQNAWQSAQEMDMQRVKFVAHIRSLKEAFLRDLRSGGAKLQGKQTLTEAEHKAEEDLMKQVEEQWDIEEARLIAGHVELQERVKFFKFMHDEVKEELEKLTVAVDKSRWAITDKLKPKEEPPPKPNVRGSGMLGLGAQPKGFAKAGMALLSALRGAQDQAPSKRASNSAWNIVRRTSMGQARRGSFSLLLDSDEEDSELVASAKEISNLLGFQEPDDVYILKAAFAFRMRDQKVLAKYVEEGEKAEALALDREKFLKQRLKQQQEQEAMDKEQTELARQDSSDKDELQEASQQEEKELSPRAESPAALSDVSDQSPRLSTSTNKDKTRAAAPAPKSKWRRAKTAVTFTKVLDKKNSFHQESKEPESPTMPSSPSTPSSPSARASTSSGNANANATSSRSSVQPKAKVERNKDHKASFHLPTSPSSSPGKLGKAAHGVAAAVRLSKKLQAPQEDAGAAGPSTPVYSRQGSPTSTSEGKSDVDTEASGDKDQPESHQKDKPPPSPSQDHGEKVHHAEKGPHGEKKTSLSPSSGKEKRGSKAKKKQSVVPGRASNFMSSEPTSPSSAQGSADGDANEDSAGRESPPAPSADDHAASIAAIVRMPEDSEEEEPDIGEDVSDRLRSFLLLDISSQRMERQVHKRTQRLNELRLDLVGKDASPLNVERLRLLPGDGKTQYMARESLNQLKASWQDLLSRRRAAGKGDQPQKSDSPSKRGSVLNQWTRSRSEDEAYEETYAKLMAEIKAA